jgi:hypothetical protein
LTEDDPSALEDEIREAAPVRVTAILNRDAGPAQEPQAGTAVERALDNLASQNLPVPADL